VAGNTVAEVACVWSLNDEHAESDAGHAEAEVVCLWLLREERDGGSVCVCALLLRMMMRAQLMIHC
jgi:hypothetical protein